MTDESRVATWWPVVWRPLMQGVGTVLAGALSLVNFYGRTGGRLELGLVVGISTWSLIVLAVESVMAYRVRKATEAEEAAVTAENERRRFEALLDGCLWGFYEIDHRLIPRDLGITVHVITESPEGPYLRNVYRRAAHNRTQGSSVRWTVGKGVIGLAWATRQLVVDNHRRIDQLLDTVDAAGWAALTPEDRLGLTYAEALALRGKYASVLAAPVFAEGDARDTGPLLGVVSIDAPDAWYSTLLHNAQVHALATQVAMLVAYLLAGSTQSGAGGGSLDLRDPQPASS